MKKNNILARQIFWNGLKTMRIDIIISDCLKQNSKMQYMMYLRKNLYFKEDRKIIHSFEMSEL